MPEEEDEKNPSSPHHSLLSPQHPFRFVHYARDVKGKEGEKEGEKEGKKGEEKRTSFSSEKILEVPFKELKVDQLVTFLLGRINEATQEAPSSASFNDLLLLSSADFDSSLMPSANYLVFFFKLDMFESYISISFLIVLVPF